MRKKGKKIRTLRQRVEALEAAVKAAGMPLLDKQKKGKSERPKATATA